MSKAKVRILQALRDGSKHGYQLAMECGLSMGSIYDHLKWLREEGFIKAQRSQGKKGPIRTYILTDRGRYLLKALE